MALESTLITHGLPYPANAEAARAAEKAVRTAGAVPATIAILHGRVRVGLSPEEMQAWPRTSPPKKLPAAISPAVLVKGGSAGTTVAATMFLAARAQIAVFATGGIGGVHRGAETTFDISADLQELGSTPIAVVAAGAKSILDIPKTLEVLETLGVAVLGYGSDEFPAFFARASGAKVEHRFDSVEDIARVIAQPPRARAFPRGSSSPTLSPRPTRWSRTIVNARIEQALADAQSSGVAGKELTPYLLGPPRRAVRGPHVRRQHGADQEQRRACRANRRGAGGHQPITERSQTREDQIHDGKNPDLGAVFDAHVAAEFVSLDVDATMATMTETPYLVHVPVLTGGFGREAVRNFYESHFVGRWPKDTQIQQISRTVGENSIVDELILRFTHDMQMPAILPGVAPTGKRVELPFVVVVGFEDGKVAHEHIYWDHASCWCRSDCSIRRCSRSMAPNRRVICSIRNVHRIR